MTAETREKRVALVTGGDQGIGQGIARDLHRRGVLLALSRGRLAALADLVRPSPTQLAVRALAIQIKAALLWKVLLELVQLREKCLFIAREAFCTRATGGAESHGDHE